MQTTNNSTVEPFERISVVVSHSGTSAVRDVYGFSGNASRVFLEATLLKAKGGQSNTVLLFMHPSSSLVFMPAPLALAEAGFHVLCCGSRYLRNDTALIMENVLVDLGAFVRHAREEMNYDKVILVGWSGGGGLSVVYQAEAEQTTIIDTPAGDPFDLGAANLLPADGVILIAAHLSRAETLTRWIDPSVLDESKPESRNRELDIYDETNEHRPPYSIDFLEQFRAAQRGRNRKISEWCLETLESLARSANGENERCFITHRTMADPYWLDSTIEPNDRALGTCYLGDPRVVNMSAVGLARFSTLRAWLSQWSLDYTHTKAADNAPRVTVPALVIENSADDATPSGDPKEFFELLGSESKSFHCISGATHYYQGQADKANEMIELCTNWLHKQGVET